VRETPVRVVAVTQSDPFFTGTFFGAFLEELEAQPVELVEIVLLPNFNESKPALALRLARLYGAVGFARLLTRYVRARGRTVEAVAASQRIPIRRLRTINDPRYLEQLANARVDVLLSVAAPEIFREQALAAAPLVLNVHTGKLPDYRGMMPTFWALLNGEDHVVITVHEMAAKVDTGPVVATYDVAVQPHESAFDVAVRAKREAGRQVARLLGRVGTAAWPEPHPLPATGGAYYRFPRRRDARRLHAEGRRLI
jgi:methionyl-tRNA formyltransferase